MPVDLAVKSSSYTSEQEYSLSLNYIQLCLYVVKLFVLVKQDHVQAFIAVKNTTSS